MYIGIDIGGTNLKAGLVDEAGNLLDTCKEPLGRVENAEELAARLAGMAKTLCDKADGAVTSVGMGVPGAVDGGTVVYTCNIPMRDIPMETLFRRHLDLPVYLGNDADCAALGEYYGGAGKGCRSLVAITLGTGIGGGMVFDGKIHTGLGMAGEVGHMVVEPAGVLCPCGRRGCWEQYASATGLRRLAWEAASAHPESLLYAMCGGDAEKMSGAMPFEAARRGDSVARQVCDDFIRYLAQGITNLVNILHPEVLAIGGGVSNEREEDLMEPVRRIVDRECYASHGGKKTRVVKACLGNDAGIIGAALLGKGR